MASRADPHRGIPKDATGVPIFLILPDGIRTSYERRMKACERAWQATGDPLAVDEAQTWAFTHRQPHPAWLHEAIGQLAQKRRTKTHAKRAIERAIKLTRYRAVRDAKKIDGLGWEEAYIRASQVLRGSRAAAKPSTMGADYKEVRRDLREGRSGLYHVIKRRLK